MLHASLDKNFDSGLVGVLIDFVRRELPARALTLVLFRLLTAFD